MVSLESMPAMRATDVWPRGANYQRRLRIQSRDDEGVKQNHDLSTWDSLRIGIEGCDGTRGDESWASVQYDDDRGGAAEGAIVVTVTADSLDLDRDETDEVGCMRYTVAAKRGPVEELVIANVVVTVVETALR